MKKPQRKAVSRAEVERLCELFRATSHPLPAWQWKDIVRYQPEWAAKDRRGMRAVLKELRK